MSRADEFVDVGLVAIIVRNGVEPHMMLFAGFSYTAEGLIFCE